MGHLLRRWSAALGVASVLACQLQPAHAQAVPTTFDVVSIRPLPPGQGPNMGPGNNPFRPGGHFTDRVDLFTLIVEAYGMPSDRLIGLPSWAQGRVYSIEARAGADYRALPPAENEVQIRLMLREMLADRFKLRMHTETREETVLIMTAERGSLKVPEVAAPVGPETPTDSSAMSDRGGAFTARKMTMSRLARLVSLWVKQDVIDQTGLTGYYDFDLRWEAPRVEGIPPPDTRVGPEGIAMFLSTLRSELGLRFSQGKGQVQYSVIDSVEPPSEN
jgi:uncharacterized protein (TIGR03435 family)